MLYLDSPAMPTIVGIPDGHLMGKSWAHSGVRWLSSKSLYVTGHVQQNKNPSLLKRIKPISSNTYWSCLCNSLYLLEMLSNIAFTVHVYADMIMACSKRFSCSCNGCHWAIHLAIGCSKICSGQFVKLLLPDVRSMWGCAFNKEGYHITGIK